MRKQSPFSEIIFEERRVFTINPSVLAKSADESRLKVMESYGRLPLYFIKNEGQLDEKVKYYEEV